MLISFDVGLFALHGVTDCSLCLSAGCLSHPPASMLLLYHMQVVHGVASFIRCMACALPRCPGRCALRVLRAWLPRSLACPVCSAPGAWAALPAGVLVAVLCGWAVRLAPWPPGLSCAGGLCAPCAWACPVGCVAGTYFPALYCGLPGGASEKGLDFRLVFFRNF